MHTPSPKIILKTGRSSLVEHSFVKHEDLLRRAVAEMVPMLHHEPKITVFNRECAQPRNVGFFSNESAGYLYSKQVMSAQPLKEASRVFLGVVNDTVGASFNGMLVNQYENGSKKIGAHSDGEAALDPSAGVLSVSWGVERTFRIRNKTTKVVECNVPTRHAHAIQMRGDFQTEFTHEIPAEMRIKEERVSITFRRHDPAREGPVHSNLTRKRGRDE